MSKIYIFSKNEFHLTHNNHLYHINDFLNLSLNDVVEDEQLLIKQNCFGYLKTLNLLPLLIKNNNFFDVYSLNENKYINLISLDFENLITDITTNNFNVKIYSNSILVTNKQTCLSYSFKSSKNNYCVEIDNYLYVFNEFNLLKINTLSFISTYLLTTKLENNANEYEILCKLPKNNTFFVLFVININDNIISIKKLKSNTTDVEHYSIPYLIFYLCKLDFDEVQKYLSPNINLEDIKKYLSNYDEIIEIENEFFIYSHNEFTKINFSIVNNIVNDID